MLKSLLSTTSLNIINITMVSFGLLTANIVKAEEQTAKQYNNQNSNTTYSPSVEFSSKLSSKRKLAEVNYMQPVFSNDDNLGIIDLKLKADNSKSKEINLGAVYRHNFDDNFIFGIYGYYDYRRTGSGLSVSGFTPGVEVLSKYVDVRANYYLPQNKKKKTKHNSEKKIKIEGTSIYAVSGGHTYEHAFRGYDVEIGTSVFAFSDDLNEKLGTKVFAAHYDFKNKNTKSITGNRFRFEQKIGKLQLGDNSLQFKLSGETQYDKLRKRQNFIGIGAKFTFDDKDKKTGLRARMMDTVVRDVDIVAHAATAAQDISAFNLNGREIKKIYYVGGAESNYQGRGDASSPMSIEQLAKVDTKDAMVVVVAIPKEVGGKPLSSQQFKELKARPEVINGREEKLVLTSTSADQVTAVIDTTKGIKLVAAEGVIVESDIKQPKQIITQNSAQSASVSQAEVALVAEPTTKQEEIHLNLDRENQQAELLREQERVAVEAERQRLTQVAVATETAQREAAAREVANREEAARAAQAAATTQEQQRTAQAAETERQRAAEAEARRITEQQNNDQNNDDQDNGEDQELVDNGNNRNDQVNADQIVNNGDNRNDQDNGENQELVNNGNNRNNNQNIDDIDRRTFEAEVEQIIARAMRAQEQNPRGGANNEMLHNAIILATEVFVHDRALARQILADYQFADQNRVNEQAFMEQIDDIRDNLEEQQRQRPVVVANPQPNNAVVQPVVVANPQPNNAVVQPVIINNPQARAAAATQQRNEAVNPNNQFDSGINAATLSIMDQNLQNLILRINQLTPAVGSENARMHVGFTLVNDLYLNNPQITQLEDANARKDALIAKIRENNQNLNAADLQLYSSIAENLTLFNGGAAIGDFNMRQAAANRQNVGIAHKTAMDISLTETYSRLDNLYGSIDTQATLDLAKDITLHIIREKVPNTAHNAAQIALNAAQAIPQAGYADARREYIRLMTPVPGETQQQREARERQALLHDAVMNIDLETEHSRVNEYLAAYRLLDIRYQQVVDGQDIFKEEIKNQYSAKNIMGLMFKAVTDTAEIKVKLNEAGVQPTPQNIFGKQKENLISVVKSFGDARRTYNKEEDRITGIIRDNGLNDGNSCAHGVCSRMGDMINRAGHRAAKISMNSIGSYGAEFTNQLTINLNALPQFDRQAALEYFAEVEDLTVNAVDNMIEIVGDRQMPIATKVVLDNFLRDTSERYQIFHNDARLRYVTFDQAKPVLQNIVYLNVNR